MENWHYLVSDYCREVCPIIVFNNSRLLTEAFLGGMQEVIETFLYKHLDKQLRFVNDEGEIKKLEEEGYEFLHFWNEEEEEEYIKKYGPVKVEQK